MRALGKYFVTSLHKRKVRLWKKCGINQDEDRYSGKMQQGECTTATSTKILVKTDLVTDRQSMLTYKVM
jgi:hypothetical protein